MKCENHSFNIINLISCSEEVRLLTTLELAILMAVSSEHKQVLRRKLINECILYSGMTSPSILINKAGQERDQCVMKLMNTESDIVFLAIGQHIQLRVIQLSC